MNSIRLDKPYEGREEFFSTHWQRLNALLRNPWLQGEADLQMIDYDAATPVVLTGRVG